MATALVRPTPREGGGGRRRSGSFSRSKFIARRSVGLKNGVDDSLLVHVSHVLSILRDSGCSVIRC